MADVLGEDAGGGCREVVEGESGLFGLIEGQVHLGQGQGDEGEVGVGLLEEGLGLLGLLVEEVSIGEELLGG